MTTYLTKPPDLSAAASALGRKGGQSTSERKAAAARENGKRGGRPRKESTMIYPSTMTIARSDYATDAEYSNAYQDAVKHYDCKVKIDDGNGGTSWKFFESAEDMRVWKKQK